jgi:hypothetical protein
LLGDAEAEAFAAAHQDLSLSSIDKDERRSGGAWAKIFAA